MSVDVTNDLDRTIGAAFPSSNSKPTKKPMPPIAAIDYLPTSEENARYLTSNSKSSS